MRFASESARSMSEGSFAGGDRVQADSRVELPQQQQPCSCSHDTEKLAKAISDLSRQMSEMSSALMGKMSSVETRLGRLENQMHDIQATVEDQRADAGSNSTRTVTAAVKGGSADVADRRAGMDVEQPCAWPPQPSVFERY